MKVRRIKYNPKYTERKKNYKYHIYYSIKQKNDTIHPCKTILKGLIHIFKRKYLYNKKLYIKWKTKRYGKYAGMNRTEPEIAEPVIREPMLKPGVNYLFTNGEMKPISQTISFIKKDEH